MLSSLRNYFSWFNVPRQPIPETAPPQAPLLEPVMNPSAGSSSTTPTTVTSMNTRIKSWDVNPQLDSPLFNGTIPAEVRQLIFEYALTEEPKPYAEHSHDFRIQYHHLSRPDDDVPEILPPAAPNPTGSSSSEAGAAAPSQPPATFQREMVPCYNEDWVRPGYAVPKTMSTALLRTCRLAYLETRDAPMRSREVCFWYYRQPPVLHRNIGPFYDHLTRYQARRIKSVHLFTQMFWLTDEFTQLCAGVPHTLRSVEHLRITLRRGDWWHNEYNAGLHINPFRGGLSRGWLPEAAANMHHDMEATKSFGREEEDGTDHDLVANSQGASQGSDAEPGWKPPLPFRDGQWGLAFSHLPSLKTLTMDFDTSEDKRAELESIVEWATRVWRFPLGRRRDGMVCLSARGNPVERMSWRGVGRHLWQVCPACRRPARGAAMQRRRQTMQPCAECRKAQDLADAQLGPRIYTFTARWTAREGEATGEEDAEGEGEGEIVDDWDEAEDDLARPLPG